MNNFKVIPIPRKDPDLDRVVAGLLALAIAELEREKEQAATEGKPKEARG